MKLISLDKKMITVSNRLTKENYMAIMLEDGERDSIIAREIIHNVSKHLYDKIGVSKQSTDEYVNYTLSAYMLSQRDILNVIKEVLEQNPDDQTKMLNQCNKLLGF